jgi:prepilin-type N-terminal cleavage/methylation domain-containing protein
VFHNLFERYGDVQSRRNDEEASEKGFTLIELLIVIVVLGILAAIVIFSLSGVTGQSAQAACKSDAKTVETAVSAYQAENPSTALPAISGTGAVTGGSNPLLTSYLHSWPTADSNAKYEIDYDPTNGVEVSTDGGSNWTSADNAAACSGA